MTTSAKQRPNASISSSISKLESAEVQLLIEQYQLQAHPEGGYFREVYRSTQTVHSDVVNDTRHAATHIYFLLSAGQFSRFHRVLHDELWHFYAGAPLRLVTYNTDEQSVCEQLIGETNPSYDDDMGEYMALVPAGDFQAAESTGAYSLVGCTVAPGFDFADFSFFSTAYAQFVTSRFPDYQRFV